MVLWAIPGSCDTIGEAKEAIVASPDTRATSGGVAIAIRPLLITSISSSSVEKRWEGPLWAGQPATPVYISLKLEPEEIGMLLRVSL